MHARIEEEWEIASIFGLKRWQIRLQARRKRQLPLRMMPREGHSFWKRLVAR